MNKRVIKSIKFTNIDMDKWIVIRNKTFKRDRYQCQRCLRKFLDKEGLSAHHIIPRIKGGGTVLHNLITLCLDCHDFVESEDNLYSKSSIIGSWEGPYPNNNEDELLYNSAQHVHRKSML